MNTCGIEMEQLLIFIDLCAFILLSLVILPVFRFMSKTGKFWSIILEVFLLVLARNFDIEMMKDELSWFTQSREVIFFTFLGLLANFVVFLIGMDYSDKETSHLYYRISGFNFLCMAITWSLGKFILWI